MVPQGCSDGFLGDNQRFIGPTRNPTWVNSKMDHREFDSWLGWIPCETCWSAFLGRFWGLSLPSYSQLAGTCSCNDGTEGRRVQVSGSINGESKS